MSRFSEDYFNKYFKSVKICHKKKENEPDGLVE